MTNEEKPMERTGLPQTTEEAAADQMTVEQWLAVRKEAALKIDPESAEVTSCYVQILDPYGVYPDLPEECQCVDRDYFARTPGSDVWVWFGDLPEATEDALWEKLRNRDSVETSLLRSWQREFRALGKPW